MYEKQVMNRKTSSQELYLLSCGYEECPPQHSYGPGIRHYDTIHFVLSGRGHYFVNDRHYRLGADQCFYIPPDTATFYKSEPSDLWTYVWICFGGTRTGQLLGHCRLSPDSLVQPLPSCEPYRQAVLELMEHPQLTPANECYIQSSLYRIIAMLEEQSGASYHSIESADNLYITQAVAYIRNSTSLDITVADICEYLHISRSYLFELFRRHLSLSPQEFLVSAKIIHARELLTMTDIPIADVAASSGYQNQFAFSRAFKKETGMAPREYREKYRHASNLLNC